MPNLEERLRSLIQRKRDDLARYDAERKKLQQEISELEAVYSASEPTEKVIDGLKSRKGSKEWTEADDEAIISEVRHHPGIQRQKLAVLVAPKIRKSKDAVAARIVTLAKSGELKDTRKKNAAKTTRMTLEVAA